MSKFNLMVIALVILVGGFFIGSKIMHNDYAVKEGDRVVVSYKEEKFKKDKDGNPIYNKGTVGMAGGVEAAEARNIAKGAELYREIDANPLFKGNVETEDRSLMNVTFVLSNEELKSELALIKQHLGLS